MNKSIKTRKIMKWKRIDILAFFLILTISIIVLVINQNKIKEIIDLLLNQNAVIIKVAVLIFVLLSLIVTMLPMLAIYYGIRLAIRNQQKKDVTYHALQQIEYYRDELEELTPAMISILMDLELEEQKDISAMILYYKQKKLVIEENNKFIMNKEQEHHLKNSDYKLIEYLNNKKTADLNHYKRLVLEEMKQEGYLKTIDSKEKKSGCFIILVVFLAFFLMLSILFIQIVTTDTLSVIDDILLKATESMTMKDELVLLTQNEQTLIAVSQMFLFGFLLLVEIAMVLFGTIYWSVTSKNTKWIKRTEVGDFLTVRIHALKNFIKDFSNLNEKTKEHLLIWNYFLIYAVVLEENDIIVNQIKEEITKTR